MKKVTLFFFLLCFAVHIVYSQTSDTIISFSGEWGDVRFKRKLFKDTLFTSVPEECKVTIGIDMKVHIDSSDAYGYVYGIITNPIAYCYYIYDFSKGKYTACVTKHTKHNRSRYSFTSPYEAAVKREKANWISILCQVDSIVSELYTGMPFKARYVTYDSSIEQVVLKTDVTAISNCYELTIPVFPYKYKK